MFAFYYIYIFPVGILVFELLKVRLINVQLESLPSMVAGVYSNDSNMQLEATTQFRKLLSIGINSF